MVAQWGDTAWGAFVTCSVPSPLWQRRNAVDRTWNVSSVWQRLLERQFESHSGASGARGSCLSVDTRIVIKGKGE
jgi:hypothetical protein